MSHKLLSTPLTLYDLYYTNITPNRFVVTSVSYSQKHGKCGDVHVWLTFCVGDCNDWLKKQETLMIDQICSRVLEIEQNCKVVQNLKGLVTFALIVAIATPCQDRSLLLIIKMFLTEIIR